MAENKYNKLAKNTLIFLAGNFGSKIVSFLIVPFYTYVLSTTEYGTVDLFTTTINLLIPFLVLGLNESVLRFLTAKELDNKSVASNCFLVFVSTTLIVWFLLPMYRTWPIFQGYSLTFVILLTLMAFNQIYLQYLRGTGRTGAFAVNGLLITIITVSANCIFLLVLRMGIQGYLYSLILAQLVAAIHIIVSSKLWKEISFKYIDLSKLKILLMYCIPLIPNSLMWWIMGASDKYMITYFVGASGNGIYTVAHKIPTIIQMFYSVFMQAWQISAIEEGQSEDRTKFYKNIYRYLAAFLMITGSGIIICAKPIYILLMNSEYKIAWMFVPLLIIANIFSCLTGFFGTTYVVNKESKRAFYTTIIGAVSNIVLNFLFIYLYGIQGAAVGTCISYIIVCVIRSSDTYKYIRVRLEWKKEGVAVALMIAQLVLLLKINAFFVYVGEIVLFIMITLLYKNELRFIIEVFKKKFLKRKYK